MSDRAEPSRSQSTRLRRCRSRKGMVLLLAATAKIGTGRMCAFDGHNHDWSHRWHKRKIFVVGLRNAHAMETQARELMERQSERLDEYPEVKAKVAAHSRRQMSSSRAKPQRRCAMVRKPWRKRLRTIRSALCWSPSASALRWRC
jgi:hypothetical protein